MQENKFNDYRIPSGMLIVFLEKALTLIHMETHLDDVSTPLLLKIPRFGHPPCSDWYGNCIDQTGWKLAD